MGAMLNHACFKDTWTKKSVFWAHLESRGCSGGAGAALQRLGSEWGRMRFLKSELRKGVCMNVLETFGRYHRNL